MIYVMLITNNEGGSPATLHPSLEAAKQAVRDYLSDPGRDPPQTKRERQEMEGDLAALTGEGVESVRGSDAWKESIYIAPVDSESLLNVSV